MEDDINRNGLENLPKLSSTPTSVSSPSHRHDNFNNTMNSTMNLIDNMYDEMKTKECRDALISHIKEDINKIVQTELKKQLEINEDHNITYERLTIEYLEKEIKYLKTELESKNKLVQHILSRPLLHELADNMDGEDSIDIYNDDVSFEISNGFTTLSEMETATNRKIDDQLTAVRIHKHQEFLKSNQNIKNNESQKSIYT